MSKHDEKRARTKHQIANAFWRLYAKKSINEIRVKDITDLAGCNRATFYLHYDDIYALLESETDEIISYIADAGRQFKDLTLDESMLLLAECFMKHGAKMDLLLGKRYNDALLLQFKAVVYPIIRNNLRLEDTLKNSLICEYTISGMKQAFRFWYAHRSEMDIEQFSAILQSLVMNGTVRTASNNTLA